MPQQLVAIDQGSFRTRVVHIEASLRAARLVSLHTLHEHRPDDTQDNKHDNNHAHHQDNVTPSQEDQTNLQDHTQDAGNLASDTTEVSPEPTAIDSEQAQIDVDTKTSSDGITESITQESVPKHLAQKVLDLVPNTDSVILTADTRSLSSRLLAFPFVDAKKIEATIDFELENHVPYDLEDMVTTWLVAHRGQGNAHVLSAMAPRQHVAEQVRDWRHAGLEPRALIFPAAALAELVSNPSETPEAVLSIGESESHLALVASYSLRFARTLRFGGASIDKALALHYALDVEKAKHAKECEVSLIPQDESDVSEEQQKIAQVVSQGLLPLVRDLMLTFKSLPKALWPSRVWLTGGTSRLPGLAGFLSDRLGIPVELLDLKTSLGNLECDPPSIGPEYAVALGLGLGMLRRGRMVPLNFRKGDFAYHGDMQIYRGGIMKAGVGLAAVFLLAIAGSIVRYSVVSSQEHEVQQGFCAATKRIVGREICNPTAALATMRQSPGIGEGLVIPRYSAATLYEMLSNVLDTSLDVTFEDIEIRVTGRPEDPDRIIAKGEAASFETTEQIIAKLKQHPCVHEAEASKQQKARNSSRVDFTLTAKIACEGEDTPESPLKTATQTLQANETSAK